MDVLILAAGLGRRFKGNKMMYEYNGKPLVTYCLTLCAPLLASGTIDHVTVVCSNESVSSYVRDNYPYYSIAVNDHPEEGISSSIRRGIRSIRTTNPASESVLILLGDMPNLSPSHIMNLLHAIQKPGTEIAVSHEKGSPKNDFRNPVIISSKYYDKLLLLRGDHGAKSLIKKQYASVPCTVGIVDADAATLDDVDTR